MSDWYAYAPITYVAKAADNPDVRLVYGVCSDETLDLDQQKVDATWLRGELRSWLDDWGNIREMHQPSAVGKALEVEERDGQFFLLSRIVDPAAVRKVDEGIYSGYSIGAKGVRVQRDPTAPMGRIVGGKLVEVSLVDRPANSNAKFVLVKAVDADDPQGEPEGDPELAKAFIPHKDGQPNSPPKGYPQQVDGDHYADPANHSWPIDNPGRIRSAIAYYNAGKGKDPYSSDEWALIGKRIAQAATKAFGKQYSLSGDQIESADDEKGKAALPELLERLATITKGEPNQDQADVAALLSASELDDSQLFLFIASLVRYALVRRLHEPAEADESLADFASVLGGIYDTLLSLSQNEADESWQYLAQRIMPQLLTSHTLEQSLQDAAGGLQQQQGATAHTDGSAKDAFAELAKVGKEFSAKNLGHMQTAHHALAEATAGDLCKAYMADNPPSQGEGEGEGQGDEMTKDEIKALVAEALAEHDAAITKSLQPATTTVEAVDIRGALSEALGPLTEELAAIAGRVANVESRAADGGPLVTAVSKAVASDRLAEQRKVLARQVEEARMRWNRATDQSVRADAFAEFCTLRTKLAALES